MLTNTVKSNNLLSLSRVSVDEYLANFFKQNTKDAQAVDGSYDRLWSVITDVALAGGKRYRPYELILAYCAFSGNEDYTSVLPAAAAQELLHIALLVHDDIIDKDIIRHGKKNVTGRYLDYYSDSVKDDTERLHLANSAAILAGDLLISSAHSLLAATKIEAQYLQPAQEIFSRAIFDVCAGELLDVESSFMNTEVKALSVAAQKTASYSFVGPLTIGAQLAGAQPSVIEDLRQFGVALGTGFQLQDDLLGIFGDSQKTGKTTKGDIVEGRRTYMVEQFYELATDTQKKEFEKYFAQPSISEVDVNTVRALLIESGAKKATEEAADEYARLARYQLGLLDMDDLYRNQFNDLIDICIKRQQ